MRPENLPREPLRITYRLRCASGEDPAGKAREIAYEQTVELPPGCAPADIETRAVGRVDTPEPLGGDRWRVTVTYERWTGGDEIPQLVNLLFGNISLKSGIVVESVAWPPALLDLFPGPRYGIARLREHLGVGARRALLCSALKPMGQSPDELAVHCEAFSAGGVDIVKDDHGLADQPSAPFEARVMACTAALQRANARHGSRTAYFPNVTGKADTLERRLAFAHEAGCAGVLISPMVVGLDTVRWVRESHELAILAHPALSGAFLQPDHGLSAELLLGELYRLIGADGVIYPNVGGRFPFDETRCMALAERLRHPPIGGGAFPLPAGGIDAARLGHWLERYGPDTIFLIGGSLYGAPDLTAACRGLMERLRNGPSPAADGST